MSVMNFQKSFRDVKPPDKGSFPLDHDGVCKEVMIKYMRCLRGCNNNNSNCRSESKDYLQCRMDNNLMKREDFDKLGFGDSTTTDDSTVAGKT